jgi:RNase P subunit RPR2
MRYEGDITCPYCEYTGKNFQLRKEWIRGLHFVNGLTCPECNGDFRYYFGERKDGSSFGYTIKVK